MTPTETVEALQEVRFRLVQHGWIQGRYSRYVVQYDDNDQYSGRRIGSCCTVGAFVTCPTTGFTTECSCLTKSCPAKRWTTVLPLLAAQIVADSEPDIDTSASPWRQAHDRLVDWNDMPDRIVDDVIGLIDRTIKAVQA